MTNVRVELRSKTLFSSGGLFLCGTCVIFVGLTRGQINIKTTNKQQVRW